MNPFAVGLLRILCKDWHTPLRQDLTAIKGFIHTVDRHAAHYHDIKDAFEKEFIGMTTRDVSIEELEETRERLFAEFLSSLDDAERRFLHSVHRVDPDWDLLGIPNV